jgi:branched-chain amino acid transport system permease protein
MLGAFFGLSIYQFTGSFWLALVLAPIPVAAIGIVMELVFMRPLYRRGHMDQVLLTFGFTFVFFDLVQAVWGRVIVRLPAPEILQGATQIGLGVFSSYRLFLIGLGFAMALLLWLFLDRSRIGAMVRAASTTPPWRRGSAPISRCCSPASSAPAWRLAALGGVAAGPVLGLYPGMDTEILIPAFIVIVIGGMGSLRGAFVGSLLIGEIDTFGKAYFPSLALFLIYLVMAVVLLVRPQGLFGIKYTGVSAAPAVTTVSTPATTQTRAVGLLAILAMLVYPFLVADYPRALLAEIYIFAIFAMSLDLLLGFTGLMSLGHAAFFGLGAYAVAILGTLFGVNAWLGLRPASPFAAAAPRLIGFFCVRTSGIPFLMLTLAFSQLVFSVALKWRDVTGGQRRHGDRREARAVRLRAVGFARHVFRGARFSSCCRIGAAAPAQRAARARLRRHPRERAAHAGDRLSHAGLQALSFTIAGAFAGLAGGLYAIFNSFISPEAIYWTSSGDILIMTMLGGAGTLIGPAIGAGVFLLMKNVVSSYSEHWLAIIGVIFICCVMFFPGGIWGTLRQIRLRRRKP